MSRVLHVVLVCLAAHATGVGCGPWQSDAPEVRNPRSPILLIVLDAASADYLGVYGGLPDASPAIDRLAEDSVVFTRAYSQTATTTPTVASLLTGVRGTTHRLMRDPLPARLRTAAELLAKHDVAFIGIIGNPHAGREQLDFHRGARMWVEVYKDKFFGFRKDRFRLGASAFKVTLPEDVNREIFELLPELGDGTLTCIHYLQPHTPYTPPREYLEALGVDETREWDALYEDWKAANEAQRASPETIALLEARYRANLRYADDAIGDLIDRLVEVGSYDETLIVLTADHGEAFFGHRQFGHNTTLYDDMVRVPLLIKFPKADGVEPRKLDVVVETIDLLPTLFDYMDLPMPDQFEGDSLWPVAAGEEPVPGLSEAVLSTTNLRRRALIEGDLKYIGHGRQLGELYDLRADPDERVDRTQTNRDTAARLHEKLIRLSKPSINLGPRTGEALEIDDDMKRLLRTLGYDDGIASDEISRPADARQAPSN